MSIVHIVCTGVNDLSQLQAIQPNTAKVILLLQKPNQDTLDLYARARTLLINKVNELQTEADRVRAEQLLIQQQSNDPRINKTDYAKLAEQYHVASDKLLTTDPALFKASLLNLAIDTFDTDLKLAARLTAVAAEYEEYDLQHQPVLFMTDAISSILPATAGIADVLDISSNIGDRPIDHVNALHLRDYIGLLDVDLTRSVTNLKNGNRPLGVLADEFFPKSKAKATGGKRK